jgi:hypothetical protein
MTVHGYKGDGNTRALSDLLYNSAELRLDASSLCATPASLREASRAGSLCEIFSVFVAFVIFPYCPKSNWARGLCMCPFGFLTVLKT